MKKSILLLALAGLTFGAFAQSAPAQGKTAVSATKKVAKPAKRNTVKKVKTVKKVHKTSSKTSKALN